jgi:SHS family lactate transporter-like MFS transporter
MVYNIGAIVGAILFGYLSQTTGRRKGMLAALALSLVVIPAWAFSGSLAVLVIAAFVMQMGVQGAWGVIPVHLNELSADAARGLMSGMAYQIGVLFGSPTNSIEFALHHRFGYQWALAGFEVVTIVVLAVLLLSGGEAHSREFVSKRA